MNMIWLLCALLPIQSVSQRVMAKYVLTPGAQCKTSYKPLTKGWELCRDAAISLGFSGDSVAHVEWNWNNTRIWGSKRPQGCFRSTGNGRFHYNSGAGGQFSGDDKILCIKTEEADTDKYLRFNIRGRTGAEIIVIKMAGTPTQRFNVKKQWHHFTFPKPATAQFSIEFVNDGGSRDVFISGIESQVVNTLPEFRSNPGWKCDTPAENWRCGSLRDGALAWNGLYTWHLKGEVAYGQNCNCGRRLADFAPPSKNSVQLCRNACEANPKCKSFGLWTKQSRGAGHCAIFDKLCVPTCPQPTATAEGYFNNVFNRNADEASENNVITWLRKLIAEGLNEIDDINNKVNISAKALAAAQSRFNDAEVKAEAARAQKADAEKKVNIVRGKCAAKQNALDRDGPDLRKEIDVFNKVILTLKDLLSGGKGLMEENKVEIVSFISLADQADPAKVAKVLQLVDALLKASEKQLKDLLGAVQSCKIELQNEITELTKLVGIWKNAVAHMQTRRKELDEFQGKHDALVQYANRRTAVVSREVDALREIIELLSTLL